MLTAINKRLSVRGRLNTEESGFTLIELLVVLVIIGVLLAIAVPSSLGFKTRAEKSAAQSNVRAAIPAMEAFYSDNGTYASATVANLKLIDSGYRVGASCSRVSGRAPTRSRSPRERVLPRSPALVARSPSPAAEPKSTPTEARGAGNRAPNSCGRTSLTQGIRATVRYLASAVSDTASSPQRPAA